MDWFGQKSVCHIFGFFKAFHRVYHYIFLQKLRAFGLGESLLKIFVSYLPDRVQKIKIGGYLFEELPITTEIQLG